MKFYVIEWDNGRFLQGELESYYQAILIADKFSEKAGIYVYTISEYDSEEDYFRSL